MLRPFAATLVACTVIGARGVVAQTTATGTIPARAQVGAVVTLSNPTEIDYGTLLPGGPSATVPPAFSSSIPHAGSIQVDFSNGLLTVNVTIDPGNELTRNGASPALITNLSCGLGISATDANAQSIGCQGQNFNSSQTGETRWIFVGGQTSAPAGAPSGIYP